MTKQIKFISAAEAVKVIKTGDHIHLSSVASAPQCLINAMCDRGRNKEFEHVHVHHLHTEGPAPYAAPEFEGIFQLDSFFVGGNVRKVTQSGYADYIPVFLSETQKLYRSGTLPCDVAMIQVSPPDAHGYVSLGTSVDATLAAVECARTVIAVINKHVPRSFGDAFIHVDDIDLFVQDDKPLEEAHFSTPNETETAIGKHCAALIEDGACLQMGIGAIPNAVLAQLTGHKDLGIRDVRRRRAAAGRKRRDQRTQQSHRQRQDGLHVPNGFAESIRLYRQQPGRRHDGRRLYERPVRHRQESEGDGDQLGPAGRSDRPDLRRFARHEILLRRRRPDRLHLRRIAFGGG